MLLGIGNFIGRGSGRVSGAAQMLAAYSDGLAIDGRDLSMVIKDTGTPANAFSGDPNSRLTYASPSTKLILGRSGLYEGGTTLRTEYDASGNAIGLRIEETARANIILRSRSLATSPWILSGIVATEGSASGIDGTAAASRVVCASGGSHYQFVTVSPSTAYRWSFFAKNNGGTDAKYRIHNNTAGSDIVAMTSYLSSINSTTYTRITVPFTTPAGCTSVIAYTHSSGSGGANIIVDACQFELASVSSPIVTAGSTVTRAADVIKIAKTDFPWNGGTGTLTVDGVVTTPTTDATHLFVVPRPGQTHVSTFKWVPA